MGKDTKEKMAEILVGYGIKDEVAHHAVEHVIEQKMDLTQVYEFLSPKETFSGIADPLSRKQAACELLRTCIAEMSNNWNAAWIGLVIIVGDGETAAKRWLSDHGYYTKNRLYIN